MERLSFIDQLVHKISTSGLPPVNMQGAMIIDPNKSPFEVNAMIIAEHIVARLSKFPLLRKKLVQDPLKVGDLRMVDDEDFDPWNHVTFATLPTPGDKRALERHMGKFSAQNLDNDLPLWQFEIIEGLEGGKIAIIQNKKKPELRAILKGVFIVSAYFPVISLPLIGLTLEIDAGVVVCKPDYASGNVSGRRSLAI